MKDRSNFVYLFRNGDRIVFTDAGNKGKTPDGYKKYLGLTGTVVDVDGCTINNPNCVVRVQFDGQRIPLGFFAFRLVPENTINQVPILF